MTGNMEDADIVTARFKEHVMAHNKKNHRAYKLSISTGMSCYDPSDPRSIDDLLNQAEKLMYEEKMLNRRPNKDMLHSKPVFFWYLVAMSINHECVRVVKLKDAKNRKN